MCHSLGQGGFSRTGRARNQNETWDAFSFGHIRSSLEAVFDRGDDLFDRTLNGFDLEEFLKTM